MSDEKKYDKRQQICPKCGGDITQTLKIPSLKKMPVHCNDCGEDYEWLDGELYKDGIRVYS